MEDFKFTIPVELYKDESYNKLRRGYLILIATLINNHLNNKSIRDYISDIITIEKSCYDSSIEYAKLNMIIPLFDNELFEDLYRSKIIRITKNMDTKSEVNDNYLLNMIIDRKIDLVNIANMKSEDLSPKHNDILLKKLEARKNQKLTYKVSSFYRCYKCKIPNTVVISEKQMRSLDEASSIICHCEPSVGGCGYRWIIN